MVKHIKIDMDYEKFYALKQIEAGFESINNKYITWQEFLVGFVLKLLEDWNDIAREEMIQSFTSQIKEEYRENYIKTVKAVFLDKKRFYNPAFSLLEPKEE
ncbi:hypothetical protein MUP77_11405 [Candidatus Bathyarchaeota archaeon]|nr:hypothetical protein [Candidatus Bathyarchaeota archaeon]